MYCIYINLHSHNWPMGAAHLLEFGLCLRHLGRWMEVYTVSAMGSSRSRGGLEIKDVGVLGSAALVLNWCL